VTSLSKITAIVSKSNLGAPLTGAPESRWNRRQSRLFLHRTCADTDDGDRLLLMPDQVRR
jgi:hypothetical protein